MIYLAPRTPVLPVRNGCIGYWPMREGAGTTIRDVIGGNTGTLTNGDGDEWITDGDGGRGLSFATDDYVKCAANSGVGNGAYSIVAYGKGWDPAANPQAIVSQRNASSPYPFLLDAAPAGGSNDISILAFDGSTVYQANSGYTPGASEVVHAVGTFDGTYLRIYVNGSLLGTSADASSRANWSNTDVLTFAAREQAASRLYLDGTIYHVILYNRALSLAEIGALYTRRKTL